MRFDHTNWLIHFVKEREYGQLETDDDTEDDYLADPFGGELYDEASAMSVLETIIKLGGIFPGHSIRNGKTTLYGGKPVICATEMPIYAFARYAREAGNNVSSYGIAFLKSEFYSAGGRPVIYGISGKNFSYLTANSRERIIDPAIIPIHEQYRYVAYSPTKTSWNDWSHEREWRWTHQGREEHQIYAQSQLEYFDAAPGLPLFLGTENGGDFSKLAVIVWTTKEAEEIQKLLTSYYLAGYNNYETQYSTALIARSKIIILETVLSAVERDRSLNAQTIEGLEQGQLLEPIVVHADTSHFQPLIDKAMAEVQRECQIVADEFVATFPADVDICGYASIVTYEITNPIVQQIVRCGLGSGPHDGKVIVRIPRILPLRQGLTYNEAIAEKAEEVLNRNLGDLFSSVSRWD